MYSLSVKPELPFSAMVVQSDTLLEHLFTFYGVNKLREIQNNEPDEALLKTWNVNAEDLKEIVEAAISQIIRD